MMGLLERGRPRSLSLPEPLESSNRLNPKVWKVIAVVLLGPLMAQMDSTIVNVSLSNIRESLHSTIASAQWIISGYLLAPALQGARKTKALIDLDLFKNQIFTVTAITQFLFNGVLYAGQFLIPLYLTWG